MTSFLCLRLHGPLASWGEIAVGERRPTSPHLSRSAVLGLAGGALGVRRDDEGVWTAMEGGLGFASRTDSPGELLVDFHTAQGPEEKLLRAEAAKARKRQAPWRRPPTRRAELSFARHRLATILSSRQYRADGLWTAALWLRPGGPPIPWSLQQLQEALRRPRFTPYLGRKSCALDLPMEPQLVEAENPVEAMEAARFLSDELLAPVRRSSEGHGTVQWEGAWVGLTPGQTVRRRDRVWNRERWQFAEREEHQARRVAGQGGQDVPEQD